MGHKLPDDPRLRVATFYMPHDVLFGDFSAGEALDADRYRFLLADMEGHGAAAALYQHIGTLKEFTS